MSIDIIFCNYNRTICIHNTVKDIPILNSFVNTVFAFISYHWHKGLFYIANDFNLVMSIAFELEICLLFIVNTKGECSRQFKKYILETELCRSGGPVINPIITVKITNCDICWYCLTRQLNGPILNSSTWGTSINASFWDALYFIVI